MIWEVVEPYGTAKTRGAFYFFVPLRDGIEEDSAVRILAEEFHVLVVPGRAFGMPGYLRISYASLLPERSKHIAQHLAQGLKYIMP